MGYDSTSAGQQRLTIAPGLSMEDAVSVVVDNYELSGYVRGIQGIALFYEWHGDGE